jgi:CheY-like chemotaxis protein
VDDNAVMRRTLGNCLESHEDWRVCDEASDRREAVTKFDKEKFDVVVLDFQMPGMGGHFAPTPPPPNKLFVFNRLHTLES